MGPDVALVDSARAAVVGRLRARQDELVREVFARVRGDAFDRAGEDDAEYVAGLRAAVVAAMEYVLDEIERGEEEAAPVPAVSLEQARRAARVGVPLETVLRRYLLGHTLFEQFVLDEAGRGGGSGSPPTPPQALRGALRAQAVVVDRLLERIAGEYGDELERIGRSPEQRRVEVVRGLLDGGASEATELDYDLGGWHLGVIATGAGAAQAVRDLAAAVDRRLLSVSQGEQCVWAWLGGREPFAAAEIELVVRGGRAPAGSGGADGMGSCPPAGDAGGGEIESHPPVVLAAGEPAQGLSGWRLTHQQAQAALVVALRRNSIGAPPIRVTCYADVALLASALKDELLGRALIEVYIAPLDDPRGGGQVLRETLRAYLAAERSVSSAAAKLGVVRKTVENRLRLIEERLGRSLHPCPVELEVALLLDELGPARTAPAPPAISITDKIVT